jgi:hypothetical protein
MLNEMRRAEPHGAEDIGTWGGILEIMAGTCVLTNALLIFVTSDKVGGWLAGWVAGWRYHPFRNHPFRNQNFARISPHHHHLLPVPRCSCP